MRNRGSIDAMAIAVILLATAFGLLSLWHLPPKQDTAVYRDLGRNMAREAVGLLSSGGRLVVITRDTTTYKQPAMQISLDAFKQEAEKSKATVEMRLVELDPLRPVEVPPGDFYETIRRAKTNDVIVSFLGPPVLEPEQEAKLKAKPKIIALCTGSMAAQANLPGLVRGGLLHAAIVNKSVPASKNATPPQLAFDQLYAVLRGAEIK
jgi:hypothetical protein